MSTGWHAIYAGHVEMKQLGSGGHDTPDIIIYITQDTKQLKETKKKRRWWCPCPCPCPCWKIAKHLIIEEYSNC